MIRFGTLCFAVAIAISSASSSRSEPFDDLHECDTFAAHPKDPNRWAKGVEDAEVIPGPAVKYCTTAVLEHPNTPRFQFQLGRALWAANRLEEGTSVFLQLEENFDYGPVYAYLGDAFYFGIGGVEPDEELAVQLYEVAAADGFAPAMEALNDLAGMANETSETESTPSEAEAVAFDRTALQPANEDNQAQVIATQSTAAMDFSSYSQPNALRALSTGNIDGLKTSGLGSLKMMGIRYSKLDIYLAGFNEQFSGTYNFKDPTCIQIYNPRVAKRLERKVLSQVTGGGTVEGSAAAGLNMILGTMQQLQSGSMMGMVDQQQQIELVREEGAKDAAKLILGYGCGDSRVQRIYMNVSAVVLGGSPVVSAEERARQAAEAAKKAEDDRKRREQEAKQKEIRRQAALRTDARQACIAEFKQAAFCGCVVEELDKAGLTESDWTMLHTEFKSVVRLRENYPAVPAFLRSCRSSASD